MRKFHKTLNEELERARIWTGVNLAELGDLILWEVAERFCK